MKSENFGYRYNNDDKFEKDLVVMAYHFEGGDLKVEAQNVYVLIEKINALCVRIKKSSKDGLTI